MFGHTHYVPLMRAKSAELRALRDLEPTLRSLTTPMLECPGSVLSGCKTQNRLEEKIDRMAECLSGWRGRTIFLDFSMSLPTYPHPVEIMAARLARVGIRPVLVVSLKQSSQSPYACSTQKVLDRHGSAICLRISPEELKLPSIEQKVELCMKRYGVSPAQVDLVIDRGGGSVRYDEFAHLIPSVNSWRTLTVLAGSFPEDLDELTPRTTHRLRRFEWRQWRDLQSWSGRRPAFGDYTIQHVYFKEPVPVPNCSASVRYTIEDHYFILRGEGVLNEGGPGRGQWNAWAVLLMGKPEFFGASFSAGDRYIAERAANWDKSGSPQSWLQAGFSHHLTTVALQVAGRLAEVRKVAATAANWASVINVDLPAAANLSMK